MFSKEPIQASVQDLHGLASCAEWTGVPFLLCWRKPESTRKAKWLVARRRLDRLEPQSPLTKALDDAMVRSYQNGERLMPGNGYPMRLLLPVGGNMNVKFLRPLEVGRVPAMSYYETRTYSADPAGGKVVPVLLPQEVILHHASVVSLILNGPGFYEISGVANSGN